MSVQCVPRIYNHDETGGGGGGGMIVRLREQRLEKNWLIQGVAVTKKKTRSWTDFGSAAQKTIQ